MNKFIKHVVRLSKDVPRMLKTMATRPFDFIHGINCISTLISAQNYSDAYRDAFPPRAASPAGASTGNPLWDYFQNHRQGRGVWKWEHYFEIYHRHFARFIGSDVRVLEIGVDSGGSLDMWRSYFGDRSHVYGVDIQDSCRRFESEHVSVFIGDQADRGFWNSFKQRVDGIDILIDDGGHQWNQQQTTLEEMLPFLRPGGVYLCEDIHGSFNQFSTYASGLVRNLNEKHRLAGPVLASTVSRYQSAIHSIHFYPYVVVIEKHLVPPAKLSAPRQGTEWESET